MMVTVLAALALGAMPQDVPPLMCPVAPEPAAAGVAKIDYAGIRFGFCCGGCVGTFRKDAATYLKKAIEDKTVVGTSLYDPVSGLKVDQKKAVGSRDAMGVRFFFASKANIDAFDKEPAKFAKTPEKAAMYCAVMKHDIKGYAEAGGYVDYKDTRYFFCCPNCVASFKKTPDAFVANAAAKVGKPSATPAKG